ncbi:pilus assembly protein [Pseudomonas jinjuensis]|uniref:Pilus assembly protein n=1 Tax=Pseudomonas jinjuensis TaxID=198616 RepID=A0A1G9Z7N1_9PSED|nr:pilus assembly protein [Pseudomonas jinjuensis]SDN16566.1 hypothetical protein SAMN05216193_101364 [Pseudomonas jinjuensis]
MRPLDLDFQPRRRSGPLGWCLLAAALVLGTGVLGAQHWVEGQTRERLAQAQHAEGQLGVGQGTQSRLSAAELREQQVNLAEMRRISAQLRRPWERLFITLETLPRKDVALLSLTPDARKGQLRITAEARDLEAMLAFHRQLEESGVLVDVSLLNHEVVQKTPEHPVLFNLLATWEVGDANP